MRVAAFLTLAAGILAAAPNAVSAATIKFDIILFVSGQTNREYFSNSHVLFDPNLGTLNAVSQTINGSLTWTPGVDPSELELFSRRLSQRSSQTFSSSPSTDPRVIDVDLVSESSDPETLSVFTGIGPIVSFFEARGTPRRPPGTLSGMLNGFVTYDYTPATPAVAEPSTWAMMMIGFVGLGYAGYRTMKGRTAARSIVG